MPGRKTPTRPASPAAQRAFSSREAKEILVEAIKKANPHELGCSWENAWKPFLLGLKETPQRPVSAKDLQRVVHFWRGYPHFRFFVLLLKDQWASLWLHSNHRFLAEKVLMREAARYSLPAADIAKSSVLCRRFLTAHPHLCVQGTAWPTCLSVGEWRKLSPREQNLIERAEDVLHELEAKAELNEAGGEGTPRDLIATAVAVRDYRVSPTTLRRLVAEGKIHDYRKYGHKKNAALILSRAEVASKYPSSRK